MPAVRTFQDLFQDLLRDAYDAEQQILESLPKLIEAVDNDELCDALESHLSETRTHVARLEEVFDLLSVPAQGRHCAGMAGILQESAELLDTEGEDAVLDAGYIAAAQRIEHYEIAVYGTLMAWATVLNLPDVVALLEENEQEEKAADAKLSELAESIVNEEALGAVN
jgi:ferritin-like metal-binding protein YciE